MDGIYWGAMRGMYRNQRYGPWAGIATAGQLGYQYGKYAVNRAVNMFGRSVVPYAMARGAYDIAKRQFVPERHRGGISNRVIDFRRKNNRRYNRYRR